VRIAVAGGTGTVGGYVVGTGRAAGHEVVVLSRSNGIDLRDPASEPGLALALDGVEVIVDAANPHTLSRKPATAFFDDVTLRLHRVLEIAGPEATSLTVLARQYLRRRGRRAAVVPLRLPGAAGRAMREGAVLPTPGVPLLGPAFAEWLESEDAASPDL
jgi:uncharacterized protein YbjT (DUF2867 family)